MAVHVEVLAVGDELCYGRVYDVNSYWLADQVTRLGGFVRRITCVRDNVDEICSALKEMLGRVNDFIFVTGGLGPTEDDRTLEALSKLTGLRVVVDGNILRAMCERRGLSQSQLQPRHYRLSSTLEGAMCLPNPLGWAPLTIVRVNGTAICAMPGPPREMQSCFTTHLAHEIEETTHCHSIARRVVVKSFESEIAPLLGEVQKTIQGIYMKSLLSEYTPDYGLPIEIIVFDSDEERCREKYAEALSMFVELAKQIGKEVREV